MELTTMAQAMQLHAQILKSDPQTQTHIRNLTDLVTFTALSPSGNISYAHEILNSLPNTHNNSFYHNTVIRAYSQQPDPTHAITLFLASHRDPTFFKPDKFTYPFLLKAAARLKKRRFGFQIHGLVLKLGLASDRYVHSLIYMYCELGELDNAFKVFDKMLSRNIVSYTLMINGLVDSDCSIKAIRLFEKMIAEGRVGVNDAAVVAVLKACADVGALEVGKRVNEIVEERGDIYNKANVRTGLIDMYAKCGCLEGAIRVFNDGLESINNNVFAWTTMISGFASHGRYQDAIDLYEKMSTFEIKPDERTMTAILSACRNVGLIDEGYAYFESMQKKYSLKPTIQHYGCIVDLFSRSGRLTEAEEFVRKMPIKPDAVLWRTLVWGSKLHGDLDRAERLLKKLRKGDCGNYVLISNVFASAGKWYDKARVRESMSKKGLVKPLGSSKIEIGGVIHEFAAGDSHHVEAEKIYEKLDEIVEHLKKEQYSPKIAEVLLEIENDEKAFQLLHHSEKLAVAYGLIKTNSGTDIRIVKNLRSCEDCHEVMKLLSKIYKRTIIVRDRIRFHHFLDGRRENHQNGWEEGEPSEWML